MRVDLHMHTYYSDGILSPDHLVKEILDKNIGLFSITDHDCIDGIAEMEVLSKKYNLEFVPGVEISTTYLNKEYHLTCYGFDLEHPELKRLLASNLKERRDFDVKLITEAAKEYDVELDDFLEYEDDPNLGGWPSLNYLIKGKHIGNINDYFGLVKEYGLTLKFKHPKEVTEIIKSCDGSVFLAHPSSNQRGGLDEEVLQAFVSFGIDGIECYTPYSKKQEEVDYYLDFCDANNLKISGGSDYHGGFVGRSLGEPYVTTKEISYEYFKSMVSKAR